MPRDKKHKSINVLEGPATEVPVEVPDRHLLVKCPSCSRVVDADTLADNLNVCPRCGFPMRVGARRRLAMTVDAGSFEELDHDLSVNNYLNFPGYDEKLERARRRSGERDAVITGIASIGGCYTALFIMDADFMMGSMGSVVGEKICRLFERATKLGLPVVGFTVSGGARMQEGVTSLMQMAKVSAAVRRHSDAGLLYICVLTDPTCGGVTASFAMEGDITISEPGALIGFAGPRVVEQTTHKRLPAGFQSAEFQLEHGFVDRIVRRQDLPATLSVLLAFHGATRYLAPDTDEHPEVTAKPLTDPLPVVTPPIVPEVHPDNPSEAPDPIRTLLETSPVSKILDSHPQQNELLPEKDIDETPASESDKAERPRAYDLLAKVRSGDHETVLPLIEQAFSGFLEFHGDRLYGDDGAVVGGIALLGRRPVTVIGTERGRNTKDRVARNFGSAHPEGYRKALRLMREAEKFGRPIVCLVDTSGAYCGIGAEERGEGEAIASNLMAMSGLKVPIISVIVGEGGSGGALALALGDRVFMLSGAIYSVVSPEGAASILWKDPKRAPEAADALRITAPDLLELGIIDDVIDDAALGSQTFASAFAARLEKEFDELSALSTEELINQRYQRYRNMGADHIC